MLAVTVVFEIKAGSVAAFRKVMAEQARNSLEKEETCRRFDVCYDDRRPERCFLYELYDDQAAFDAHRATDHFKNFAKASDPLVESRQVDTWTLQPAD